MINREALNELPSDFLIINAARGPLIDEKVLIEKLKQNPHAYAVLDVFEEEPFSHQFEGLTNIHLTSHIAGVSSHLPDHMISFEEKVIRNFREDKDLQKSEFRETYKELILSNRIIQGELI